MMTAERRAAWLKRNESRSECATTANEYAKNAYIVLTAMGKWHDVANESRMAAATKAEYQFARHTSNLMGMACGS